MAATPPIIRVYIPDLIMECFTIRPLMTPTIKNAMPVKIEDNTNAIEFSSIPIE